MDQLGVIDGDIISVRSAFLQKGSYIKLQPRTEDFLNLHNPLVVSVIPLLLFLISYLFFKSFESTRHLTEKLTRRIKARDRPERLFGVDVGPGSGGLIPRLSILL